jgi:hypothetical protein
MMCRRVISSGLRTSFKGQIYAFDVFYKKAPYCQLRRPYVFFSFSGQCPMSGACQPLRPLIFPNKSIHWLILFTPLIESNPSSLYSEMPSNMLTLYIYINSYGIAYNSSNYLILCLSYPWHGCWIKVCACGARKLDKS